MSDETTQTDAPVVVDAAQCGRALVSNNRPEHTPKF